MEYNFQKTISNILLKLTQEIPIVEVNDILETQKTIYKNKDGKLNNIIIEGEAMSQPLATSASAKAMMKKDNSLLSEIYLDLTKGDLLKVVDIKGNNIICENISMKEDYRKKVVLDKMDILLKDFCVVERVSASMKNIIDKLKKENES